MANQFNLTAMINTKLNTGSLGQNIGLIKKNLQGISGNVNVKVSNTSQSGLKNVGASVQKLNTHLKTTAAISRRATSSMQSLGSSAAKISQHANKTSQAMLRSNTSIKKVGSTIKKSANEIEEFGRVSGLAIRRFAGFTIATTVVFGLGRAITGAFSEAIKFQKELIKVAQVTDNVVENMGDLSKEIKRVSVGFGVASSELIGVSRILAQTGMTAGEVKVALEALAKASLSPTFGSMEKTGEGAIAMMRQFKIEVQGLDGALGSINAVASKFAVESDDIIAAIRRAGGVFAAASHDIRDYEGRLVSSQEKLNQFIAIFTSVRATTRESAESIATGLRTIFTRMQRGSTISELKKLGINLQDTRGKFVGAYQAIDILGRKLKQLDPRDSLFSKIAESLGGFRQISKVIPLIAQTETRMKALKVAQGGSNSTTKDAIEAQKGLANQLIKTREQFFAMIRGITDTSSFKMFIRIINSLAGHLIRLADAFKPLMPLLGAFLAVKGLGITSKFLSKRGFRAGLSAQNPQGFAKGGVVGGGSNRGLVPGVGNRDTVPAYLEKGEFVIRKKAVQSVGAPYFDSINHFAGGGIKGETAVGAAMLSPPGIYKGTSNSVTVTPEKSEGMLDKTQTWGLKREGLPKSLETEISSSIRKNFKKSIKEASSIVGAKPLSNDHQENLVNSASIPSMAGHVFESILLQLGAQGEFSAAMEPTRPFDFPKGSFSGSSPLAKHYKSLTGLAYVDAKSGPTLAEPARMKSKILDQLALEGAARKKNQQKGGAKKTVKGKADDEATKLNRRNKAMARLAKPLRSELGKAEGGMFNSLVMPGEYIMDKSTVRKVGLPMMEELNHIDRFEDGGEKGGDETGRRLSKRRVFLKRQKEREERAAAKRLDQERSQFTELKKSKSHQFRTHIIKKPVAPIDPSIISSGARSGAARYRQEKSDSNRPMRAQRVMQGSSPQSVEAFIPAPPSKKQRRKARKARRTQQRTGAQLQKRDAASQQQNIAFDRQQKVAAKRVYDADTTQRQVKTIRKRIDQGEDIVGLPSGVQRTQKGLAGQKQTAKYANVAQQAKNQGPPGPRPPSPIPFAQSVVTGGPKVKWGSRQTNVPSKFYSNVVPSGMNSPLMHSAVRAGKDARAFSGAREALAARGKSISGSQKAGMFGMRKAVGLNQATMGQAQRKLEKEYARLVPQVGKQNAAIMALNKATVRLEKGYQKSVVNQGIGSKIKGKFRDIGSKGGLGGKAANFARGLSGKMGMGSMIAGPLLASQFDPGGTNANVQGVSGALSGAGMGAMIGGPWGAAAGAIVGGMSAASDAKAAKARFEADKKTAIASKKLEAAFEGLTKNGVKGFDEWLSAIGESTAAADLSTLAHMKESSSVGERVFGTGGVENAFAAMTVNPLEAVMPIVGKWLGVIPDALNIPVSGEQEQKDARNAQQRTSDQKFRGEALQRVAQESGSVSKLKKALEREDIVLEDLMRPVKKTIDSQGDKGFIPDTDAPDLRKKERQKLGLAFLDPNTVQGTTLFDKDTGELNKTGQAAAEEAFLRFTKMQIEERELRDKLTEASRASATAIEDLVTQFAKMGAAAKRAATVSGLSDSMLGTYKQRRGGQVSIRNFAAEQENPFENNLAYTPDEIRRAGSNLASRTGDEGGRVSKATALAASGTNLQQNVNRVLADASKTIKEDRTSKNKKNKELVVNDALDAAFSDAPKELLDAMKVAISKAFESGKTLDEIVEGGGIKNVGSVAYDAAMKSLLERTNTELKIRSDYSQKLSAELNFQLGLTKQMGQHEARAISQRNQLREAAGLEVTRSDKVAPMLARVRGLTQAGGIGGGGTTDIGQIEAQMTRLKTQRGVLEAKGEAFRGNAFVQGGGTEADNLKALGLLDSQLAANTEALNILANDTTALAAIQSEIAQKEKNKEDANKSVLDLMQGGFKDQAKFQQRLNVLTQFLKDPSKLSPKLQAKATKTAEDLGPLAKQFFPKMEKQIDANLQSIRAQATAPFLAQLGGLKKQGLDAQGNVTDAEKQIRAAAAEEAIQARTNPFRQQMIRDQGGNPMEEARRNDWRAQGFPMGPPGSISNNLFEGMGPNASRPSVNEGQRIIDIQERLAKNLTAMQRLPEVLLKLDETLNKALGQFGGGMGRGVDPAGEMGGARGGGARDNQIDPAGEGGAVPDQIAMSVTHQFDINIMGADGLEEGIKNAAMIATTTAMKNMGINTVDGSIEARPMRGIA